MLILKIREINANQRGFNKNQDIVVNVMLPQIPKRLTCCARLHYTLTCDGSPVGNGEAALAASLVVFGPLVAFGAI